MTTCGSRQTHKLWTCELLLETDQCAASIVWLCDFYLPSTSHCREWERRGDSIEAVGNKREWSNNTLDVDRGLVLHHDLVIRCKLGLISLGRKLGIQAEKQGLKHLASWGTVEHQVGHPLLLTLLLGETTWNLKETLLGEQFTFTAHRTD